MTMTVESFFGKAKSDAAFASRSRLLIVRSRHEQTELRKLLEERPAQFTWVRVSKCVSAEAFVPSADRVLADLREAVVEANSEGKTAYVTGLSALLAIWDLAQRTAAFERLRAMLDDLRLGFFAVVNDWYDEAKSVFVHPRYVEGQSIMVVGDRPAESGVPEIRLVAKGLGDFMDGVKLPSLSVFVNDYEIGGFAGQILNICISSYTHELACVGGGVKQVFREGDFLRLLCNYRGGLGEGAERWLFLKMADAGMRCAAKDFVQRLFFQGDMGSVCRDAPGMIHRCKDEEQEVLVWMLRQSLHEDSYLRKVLDDPNFNRTVFKSIYVNEAISLIGTVNERALCAERREGIAAMLHEKVSLDAEMAEFVELVKDVDSYQLAPWLTNGTSVEVEECVRRLRKSDLRTLPAAFYEAFPELKDYLAPYAFGDAGLESYFTEYRAIKISNEVTPEFCKRAKDVQYPIMNVKSRDDLLNDSSLADAALLVVDAMGLEYMPMIVSLAAKQGLGIANAVPAMARIPTSTRFNKIEWPESQLQNGIPELDNIIHNGVYMHGKSTDEENFIAMLKVISNRVMTCVAKALAKHGKVVLTADHGASRLAVLANKAGLASTLPVKGVAESAADWRYLIADPNAMPPDGVASNISGDWWVVKGYDRFSKSGGKLNELHGGLTYEEALVPFVVFEKGATFKPTAGIAAPQEQFVENKDFDL